jgi:hypothetical protein
MARRPRVQRLCIVFGACLALSTLTACPPPPASTGNGNTNGSSNSNGNGATNANANTSPPPAPGPAPTSVQLELIAESGDEVPDQSGATFTRFGDPIIDADGRVAFWAEYDGGSGDAGLYVFQNSALQRVIDNDPTRVGTVPGGGADEFFGAFEVTEAGDSNPFSWGAGGRLVFVASGVAGAQASERTRGVFRWRASDADLILVAEMPDLADVLPNAGADGSTINARFFSPLVIDSAVVVFRASYFYVPTGGTSFVSGTGVFASNGTKLIALADEQVNEAGDVPGQGATTTFTDFAQRVAINTAGTVLLQASYGTGSGDRGLYVYSGDSLSLALDNGTAGVRGLSTGTRVGALGADFPAFSVGGRGHLAVQTVLTASSQTRDAVLLRDNGTWIELLSADNDEATALASGVNIRGQCLILAGTRPRRAAPDRVDDLFASPPSDLASRSIEWQPTGGAINDDGRCLIRYSTIGDGDARTPGLALWTGDELLIVADPLASVGPEGASSFTTQPRVQHDYVGRSGALNNSDEMTFRAVLGETGNPQQVYIGRGSR